MQSIKSRIINTLLRNRHLFQLKLKQEAFDMNTSIADFRAQCEKSASRIAKLPDDILTKPEIIAGINSEWIIPHNSNENKLILYFHGGGYVSGSCSDHRAIVAKFAKYCRLDTLMFEYRLAPEHKFPAALDDFISIYKALLSRGHLPQNIVFAGESAGGGLCLSSLLYAKEKNLPMPAAAVAISPWTDLTCAGDSYISNEKKCLSPKNSWTVFSNHYLGASDKKNPLASPVFGDLSGLPPLLLVAGGSEILRDDSVGFFEKTKFYGIKSELLIGKGMVHCYPLLAPFFKEATEAMDKIKTFIHSHL